MSLGWFFLTLTGGRWALVGLVLGLGNGVLMLARPQLFFGPDEYDAHDPRTVRFFGGAIVTLTTPLLAFFLYRSFTE